jgi:hypothetical protein
MFGMCSPVGAANIAGACWYNYLFIGLGAIVLFGLAYRIAAILMGAGGGKTGELKIQKAKEEEIAGKGQKGKRKKKAKKPEIAPS